MASDYFRRMRSQARRDRSEHTEQAEQANPWTDTPSVPRLSDLSGSASVEDDERSARYAEWAARMQEKRARTQERIKASAAPAGGASGGTAADGPTYWTTDALFAESERVAKEELIDKPNPWRVHELLALLDLRPGATADQISDAYKHLAKAHHPDRFAMADEVTQQFHADRMLDINKAYRALRQLEQV